MSKIKCVEDLVHYSQQFFSIKSEEAVLAEAVSLIDYFRNHYLRRALPKRFAELDRQEALRRAEESKRDSDETQDAEVVAGRAGATDVEVL